MIAQRTSRESLKSQSRGVKSVKGLARTLSVRVKKQRARPPRAEYEAGQKAGAETVGRSSTIVTPPRSSSLRGSNSHSYRASASSEASHELKVDKRSFRRDSGPSTWDTARETSKALSSDSGIPRAEEGRSHDAAWEGVPQERPRPVEENPCEEQARKEWSQIRAALQVELDVEPPPPPPVRALKHNREREWRNAAYNYFPTGMGHLGQDEVVEFVLERQEQLDGTRGLSAMDIAILRLRAQARVLSSRREGLLRRTSA